MSEPAYMRIRYRNEDIPGPLTISGEGNLWEIHEFSHAISGKEPDDPWARAHWDTKHKVVRVVLEAGSFLPRLYSVNVANCEYINRVEIFWQQYSDTQKKNIFYFKHTIYPVKITAITMLMPNVKEKRFEKYNHLVSLEFRYRYIEHLYTEGYLHNKAEWKYFFADESFEPIPEEYLTGRCLSHEALEWEENWRNSQTVVSLTNPRWTHTNGQRREESPEYVKESDTINLSVDVTGAENGEQVTFRIFNDDQVQRQEIALIEGIQTNGCCSVEWTVNTGNVRDKEDVRLAFCASCAGQSTSDVDISMERANWGTVEGIDGEMISSFLFTIYNENNIELNCEYTDNNGLIPAPFGRTEEHTVFFRQMDTEE